MEISSNGQKCYDSLHIIWGGGEFEHLIYVISSTVDVLIYAYGARV